MSNQNARPQAQPPDSSIKPDAIFDPKIGELPAELAALDAEELASQLPTISEVGKVLPLGYRDAAGGAHRTFDLCEWNWEVEEALGELAEKNQDMSMGTYISEVIGVGLRVLGDIDFTRLKRGQRRLVVSNLYQADALYIYVWIRIAGLGANIRFDPFKCGKCKKQIDFVGDLRTLEVKVHKGADGKDGTPSAVVNLDSAFEYGKVDVKQLTVGPLKWAFMETDDVATLTNPAKFRLAVLRHGVIGVTGVDNDAPVVLTREHARQIGPAGINRIVAAVDELGGGVVMECAGRCIPCGNEFRQVIDWTHDNFFGRSSR